MQSKIPTRRISIFLNPSGQDLIFLLAQDTKRNHRLDFLEMEYYRFLYKNEKLHDHLTYDNGLLKSVTIETVVWRRTSGTNINRYCNHCINLCKSDINILLRIVRRKFRFGVSITIALRFRTYAQNLLNGRKYAPASGRSTSTVNC